MVANRFAKVIQWLAMSFFDSIARIGTAIVTGGTSEIVRLVAPRVATSAQQLLFPTTPRQLITTAALAAAPLTFGATGLIGGTSVATRVGSGTAPLPSVALQVASRVVTPIATKGVQPMGLDLGAILGVAGNLLGQVSAVPALQGLGQLTSSLAPAFSPTFATGPMTTMPAVIPVSTRQMIPRGTSLTQDVFTAGAKVLGQLGIPYAATAGSFSSALRRTLSSIGSLARRTPAGTIVSILIGLGLTAFESNLLVAWHSQRKRGRRMNAANSKALRRAARRIKSFHKLCQVTDLLKTRSRSRRSAGTCTTCRKNPCRC